MSLYVKSSNVGLQVWDSGRMRMPCDMSGHVECVTLCDVIEYDTSCLGKWTNENIMCHVMWSMSL